MIPTGLLHRPRCQGPRWNRSPAISRSKIGMPYAIYRPITAIEVTAK
jgi:hypothetical protein